THTMMKARFVGEKMPAARAIVVWIAMLAFTVSGADSANPPKWRGLGPERLDFGAGDRSPERKHDICSYWIWRGQERQRWCGLDAGEFRVNDYDRFRADPSRVDSNHRDRPARLKHYICGRQCRDVQDCRRRNELECGRIRVAVRHCSRSDNRP